MRKIGLIVLTLALALPAVALALGKSSSTGALAVNGASGTVFIQGTGVIYGHFDQGKLMVLAYKPDLDSSGSAVSSPRAKFARGSSVYTASDVRFLFPAGTYTLELIATGIDITAVGAGHVVATSASAPGSTQTPVTTTPTVTSESSPAVAGSAAPPVTVPLAPAVVDPYGTISVNGGKPVPLTRGSTYETYGVTVPKSATLDAKVVPAAGSKATTTTETVTSSSKSSVSVVEGGK